MVERGAWQATGYVVAWRTMHLPCRVMDSVSPAEERAVCKVAAIVLHR